MGGFKTKIMTYVKHFFDPNWLIRNDGYKNLEDQINYFLNYTTIAKKVVDIKYQSVFNPNINDIHGNPGVVQFSAILIYEV